MTRGSVVLAGRDRGGSWWCELVATGPNPDGCWEINGGSFGQGTTIWFSSGLRVPKAAGFKLVDSFDVPDPFPGQQADTICVGDDGTARYFRLARGL
jgi:hypothetical protein